MSCQEVDAGIQEGSGGTRKGWEGPRRSRRVPVEGHGGSKRKKLGSRRHQEGGSWSGKLWSRRVKEGRERD